MAKWKNNEPKSRKPGSGRKPKIMTAGTINRLKGLLNNRSGTSTRKIANKFKCDHSYIVKTIKNKTNICYFKKKQIPDRTEKQLKQLQLKCGRICRKFRNRDFVIDDESYFIFKHTNKNSNVGFYSDDAKNAPKNVKYKRKSKFEKKILVWITISPRGISKPFIVPARLAINQTVYKNDCIIKRLIPFINKHHSDGNYVFWPDLASSHNARSVTNYLNEKNIRYATKFDNPACVPELRPIEDFWSILKG